MRVAVVLILCLSGQLAPAANTPIPLWAYAGLSLTFGALGATLLMGNRDDVRAAWLGGVLLLIAVPLTGRILHLSTFPIGPWVDPIRPDAFLPAFLWRFLLKFSFELPARPRSGGGGLASGGFVWHRRGECQPVADRQVDGRTSRLARGGRDGRLCRQRLLAGALPAERGGLRRHAGANGHERR